MGRLAGMPARRYMALSALMEMGADIRLGRGCDGHAVRAGCLSHSSLGDSRGRVPGSARPCLWVDWPVL